LTTDCEGKSQDLTLLPRTVKARVKT
jgi:hypothetical protein